ncbi:MAG: CHAT domain-containing protein [Bacteroidales bacterium]|nr:MAG: CHAT domain-containing protein [Bacteroidales bacterium]
MSGRKYFAYLLLILCYTGNSFKSKAVYQPDINSKTLRSKTDSIEVYNDLGIKNVREGDFETAGIHLTKSLNLLNKYSPEDYEKLVFVYTRLGVVNTNMWNFKNAIDLYNKAEKLCRKYGKEQNKDIGFINYSEGRIFKELGDYKRAEQHYLNALGIFESDNIPYSEFKDKYISIIYTYNSLGVLHFVQKKYETAISYYKICEKLSKTYYKEFLPVAYENIADCYYKLKKYDDAESYFERAIKYHITSKEEVYKFLLSNVYSSYSQLCIETGKFEKAYDLLQKSCRIYINHWGLKHPFTSGCFLNFGKYFEKTGNIDSALYYYQKSIISLAEDFDDSDFYNNPEPAKVISALHVVRSLKSKAQALSVYYNKTGKIKDLVSCMNTYDLAIQLIDNMRLGYQTQESKLFLSENEKDTYTSAINTAYRLWNIIGDKHYMRKAFEYAEKSKASVLLAALRSTEAKSFAGIPGELLLKENNLLKDIALYKEFIFEEKRNEKPDENKLKNWEQRLFDMTSEYDNLTALFEDSFPKYYSLKYNTAVATPDSLQRLLSNNQSIVEYSLSDTSLFIFHIGKNEMNIFHKPVDSVFHNSLKKIIYLTGNFEYLKSDVEDLAGYISKSNYLYNYLLKPVAKFIRNKKLIIVPDELLAFLPFEALVINKDTEGRASYKNLNYLLQKHIVSYALSSTLYFRETKHKPVDKIKKLLAFAPSYSGDITIQDIMTRQRVRDHHMSNLYPIPGVMEEVNGIGKIISSDIFEGQYATEKLFKDTARYYDMLHLSMHTIINNNDPMYSKLAFTFTDDTTDDGLLNTHEIYNMRLNARLAVLSSCSSGEGILRKGEGVMSLARAFMYAGCPGIIMTLWVVEDKSGIKLMINFYKELVLGKSKDQALRIAKLKFIEEATLTKAHPFYWSSYICVGNVDPLFIPKTKIIIIIGAVVVSVVILMIIKRIIKKRRTIPPASESAWFKV